MSTLVQLCESKDVQYSALMEAVEEFVDGLIENATLEVYQATAKRLLGESLDHSEIMLDVPYCTPDDLIVLERASSVSDVKFNVSTNTQIRTMLTRLKLGRKGLQQVWDEYQSLLKRDGKSPEMTMARVAGIFGLDTKTTQIILTKMSAKQGKLKEQILNMAEVLVEETPTNTSGGTMADHEPTDGKRCAATPKKRKKLSDLLKKKDDSE